MRKKKRKEKERKLLENAVIDVVKQYLHIQISSGYNLKFSDRDGGPLNYKQWFVWNSICLNGSNHFRLFSVYFSSSLVGECNFLCVPIKFSHHMRSSKKEKKYIIFRCFVFQFPFHFSVSPLSFRVSFLGHLTLYFSFQNERKTLCMKQHVIEIVWNGYKKCRGTKKKKK